MPTQYDTRGRGGVEDQPPIETNPSVERLLELISSKYVSILAVPNSPEIEQRKRELQEHVDALEKKCVVEVDAQQRTQALKELGDMIADLQKLQPDNSARIFMVPIFQKALRVINLKIRHYSQT